ncbi:MAG: FAD-dependent oxidoreductase, partial [Victivallales bacterium]|nr:FAD-dependent oxidoreductase [Victivallales bacterium]
RLRKEVPGFANAYLADAADQLGITETRRLVGDYVLGADDDQRSFDDAIAVTGHWTRYGARYQIPYRALHHGGVGNLLVSGRCISVDRRVHNATKEIPACMATGQAAGTAAALAANGTGDVGEVDIDTLREALVKAGAILSP